MGCLLGQEGTELVLKKHFFLSRTLIQTRIQTLFLITNTKFLSKRTSFTWLLKHRCPVFVTDSLWTRCLKKDALLAANLSVCSFIFKLPRLSRESLFFCWSSIKYCINIKFLQVRDKQFTWWEIFVKLGAKIVVNSWINVFNIMSVYVNKYLLQF